MAHQHMKKEGRALRASAQIKQRQTAAERPMAAPSHTNKNKSSKKRPQAFIKGACGLVYHHLNIL